MKKVFGVIAIIGLAVGLTWAADQLGGWLGFSQQESARAEEQSPGNEGVSPSAGNESTSPGNEGVSPSNTEPETEGESPPPPELSAEVISIEEDLARIEEALQSDEVLEEFTPSEPLSADNPILFPTDI